MCTNCLPGLVSWYNFRQENPYTMKKWDDHYNSDEGRFYRAKHACAGYSALHPSSSICLPCSRGNGSGEHI